MTERKEGGIAIIDRLQEAAKALGAISDYEIEKLYAILDWALAQQPVRAGDRVEIIKDLKIKERFADGKACGWFPYRECLAVGKTGVVHKVEFFPSSGRWNADVTMDTEWTVHVKYNGETRRYPCEGDKRGVFCIPVDALKTLPRKDEESK